ncbi:MAG: hypothetical protein Q8R02_20220 [Hyphomonadaceae bacterium]|nr:hypothetical protein [Hyphomonadaceae bacterium]
MRTSNVALSNLSDGEMSQLVTSVRLKTWLEQPLAALIKGANASGMSEVGAALRKMSESVAPSQKASGASDAV